MLDGLEEEEIIEHLGQELDFIPPTSEDVRFLVSTLRVGKIIDDEYRKKCDVDLFDEDSEDLRLAFWVVENEDVREAACRCLHDGISARNVGTILSMKFGKTITEGAVSIFRRGFWDTVGLTKIDFHHYFVLGNVHEPDPPSVPLHMRTAAAAWDEGILPSEEDLSSDEIIRTIQVSSFMEFSRLRDSESPCDKKEMFKWASFALKASLVAKPKKQKSDDFVIPGLRDYTIHHADQSVPSIDDIQQPPEGEEDEADFEPGDFE